MIARSIRTQLFLLTILAGLFAARNAAAQQTCTNDVDCPNAACGGDICDWADSAHPMTCKAAGSYDKEHDGWCTVNEDCKCMAMGATCSSTTFSCTFTRPCEADGGTCAAGGTGTAGTSGGGGGGGGGGCSIAGESAGGRSALLAAIGLVALRARRRRR